MPFKKRITLLIPGGLGPASKFGKTSRPLARLKNGSLEDGELVLQLTLKHLRKIRRMSREMGVPRPELFKDAKSEYDDLTEELSRLQEASESTSLINFLRRLEIRRDTQALLEAGRELYIVVKSTSDKMERRELSYNSVVEEVEEGDIALNEYVRGVAIDTDELSDEETDVETASILTADPFADPIAPDYPNHTDNQIFSPSLRGSAQSVINMYFGCVNADNSDTREITMNNGGTDQSGRA